MGNLQLNLDVNLCHILIIYQIALKYAEVSRGEIQVLFSLAILSDPNERINLIRGYQEAGTDIPAFYMRILDGLCQAHSEYVRSEMPPPASACSEMENMFSNMRM